MNSYLKNPNALKKSEWNHLNQTAFAKYEFFQVWTLSTELIHTLTMTQMKQIFGSYCPVIHTYF